MRPFAPTLSPCGTLIVIPIPGQSKNGSCSYRSLASSRSLPPSGGYISCMILLKGNTVSWSSLWKRKTGGEEKWLDDWVLCRIYKKNSSSSSHKPLVISATAAISGKEHSYVSSSSSSSLDDMLALPPMDIDRFFAHPQMDSMKAEQQPQEEKPCLQGRLGSGGFDWATLAGISSQTQLSNYVNNDALYAPANCNLAATQVRRLAGCPVVDEEVQSGLRGGARQNLGVFHRG
ncbi:hypothetical protein SAY86_006499 [Trapa natans]|uniref:NAC domain-containing protein n=1 Tax=Trapa natans TaxID=22666 RepID=A0AAN7LDK3_TRANT|nr:hypothetical protein SAY86_006499 [Trapa natans]